MMRGLRQTFRAIYPWVVIALCALFLFYKYILQVSPSVMTNELMRFFHIHAAGLGNLAATFFYAYLVMQLFAGPMLDKYSPRVLMSSAIFVSAFGTLVFSVAHVLWIAALGRMLVGVGAAFATVGYMKMAAVYFPPRHFAFVGGLLATAAMVGAVLGETPLAYMVHIFGWHQSLFDIALAGFFVAFLFFLVVRDKKKDIASGHRLPKAAKQPLGWQDFLVILKRRQNWMLAFYSGMAFAPVAVFGGLWGNPFLQEAYHFGRLEAANYISLIFVGLAVGGPLLGWLSDRYQVRLRVMAAGTAVALVSMSAVIYLPMAHILLASMLFIFGVGTGSFMLGFATGKDINPTKLAATVIALINTGDAIFGAVTEPLVGKMLDHLWQGRSLLGVHYYTVKSYQMSLSILVLYLLLALGLTLVLKGEKKRSNLDVQK